MFKATFTIFVILLLADVALAGPNVLVLHSYHHGCAWTASIHSAVETVLRGASPGVEFAVEYMDSKRRPPAFIFPVFKRFLAQKYADHQPDLILSSDDNALDFLLAFRDELFPGVPVVFCGINNFESSRLSGRSDFTGVAEATDLGGTLELITKLHPQTRQVAVISDRTPSGLANLQRFEKAAARFADRLQFMHLSELSVPELEKELAALPASAVVLLLAFSRDGQGNYLSVRRGNQLICAFCNRPVYSLWDFRVRNGVVGGHVTSGRQQGLAAADMALRILQGASPEELPVFRNGPNEYLFDYQALERFDIPLAALPAGSRILNRPAPALQLSQVQLLFLMLVMGIVILALLANIVWRRKAERALHARQARLKAIYDNIAAGIALADPHGRYLEVNDRWAEMFGCSPAEMVGKSFFDLIVPEDRDQTRQGLHRLIEGKLDCYRLQKRFTRDDGSVIWCDHSATPVVNDKGEVEALTGIIIDISEHKQAEAQLRATNRELDAFVQTASHDLRSPLTVMIGYAEYLHSAYLPQLDKRGQEILLLIEQSGHKMLQLLEDLLAFARVGYVEAPAAPVDVESLVCDIAIGLCPRGDGSTVRRGTLPSIHMPRSFLVQIFDNLIGNAMRYANRPGRPVEVGGAMQGDRVRYFVRDFGPGIEPEERDRVFDPFYRGTTGRDIAGTGIGLATVRKIARLYGGKAWLEETPGGGCTFWVEMCDPLARAARAASPPSGGRTATRL